MQADGLNPKLVGRGGSIARGYLAEVGRPLPQLHRIKLLAPAAQVGRVRDVQRQYQGVSIHCRGSAGLLGRKLRLPPAVTLLGFCGAPWTLATYMIAGCGTVDQFPARLFAYRYPEAFAKLIDLLAEALVDTGVLCYSAACHRDCR